MTELLLDTHVAIWWLADDRRLTGVAKASVLGATAVHVSAASTWEVAIKQDSAPLTRASMRSASRCSIRAWRSADGPTPAASHRWSGTPVIAGSGRVTSPSATAHATVRRNVSATGA